MQDLAAIFEDVVEASGMAGAQLSIIKGGERIDLAAELRDVGQGEPMTVETTGQVGSVTKVFNAVLVLELVARGKLDLDEPIIRKIPELKLGDADAASKITLRHLVSMSAGIDNGDYHYYDSLRERIENLRDLPQHHAPGEGYGYSNAATDLSGYVVERAMGRSWDDLLREFVLDPAKLSHTTTRDAEQGDRMGRGHVLDPATKTYHYVEKDHFSLGSAPAGSTLTSNAADLANFGKALLDGYLDAPKSIYARGTIQGVFTPQADVPVKTLSLEWCLGPGTLEWQGTRMWWHPGGNNRGVSMLFIIPSQNAVLACTGNTPNMGGLLNAQMTGNIFPKVFGISPPPRPEVVNLPLAEQSRFLGTYAALMGELHVEQRDDRLFMRNVMRLPGNVMEFGGYLDPIGPGRFWLNVDGKGGPTNLPETYMEVALFGADTSGRATTAVTGLCAYSRAYAESCASGSC